jgi:hypothetical protein
MQGKGVENEIEDHNLLNMNPLECVSALRALRIYRFYQFAILQFMFASRPRVSDCTHRTQVIKICMCKVGLKR